MKSLFPSLIRLSCSKCDREDYDGVYGTPDGWIDVQEDRIANYELHDWHWWTHSGVCPDCSAERSEQ